MTTIPAAIIRLLETLVPSPNGSQREIDKRFEEIVAGFESA